MAVRKIEKAAAILLAFFLIFSTGCGLKPADNSVPRPHAGYLRWLERESMLAQASGLIKQVSQTSRMWLNAGQPQRSSILLKAAPSWVEAGRTPFRSLQALLSEMPGLGLGGLYLAHTRENSEIWLESDSILKKSRGDASFAFDPALGGEDDFGMLVDAAEKADIQLGTELVPAATGRGPDFILQARNAPAHQGMYAMLPVAPSDLPGLPQLKGEWDFQPLDGENAEKLVSAGILPGRLARDDFVWTNTGGWALSGEIIGMDGRPRRWLYRYHSDPRQPVMLWQDPSGAARRVYSAAIIQQVGLEGIALAGLRIGAFMGLEPAPGSSKSLAERLAPGLDALNDLVGQIHRYGGWAMLADPLPSEGMAAVLAGACDFCLDAFTPLLFTLGMVEGDGRPLALMHRQWLEMDLDQRRLARWVNCGSSHPLILKSLPAGDNLYSRVAPLFKNRDTPPLSALFDFGGNQVDNLKMKRASLRFRLGMPGLAFMESGDLSTPGAPILDDPDLKRLLKSRNDFGVAQGEVIQVGNPETPVFSMVLKTPVGACWLLACNFAASPQKLEIKLPFAAAAAMDAESAGDLTDGLFSGNRKFRLTLDGLQVRNVVFQMK